jgi:Putative Ig domain
MGLTAFDPNSSTNGMPRAEQSLAEIHANSPDDRARALADILQNKFLSSTFGVEREWEVRTTVVTNRHAWRYRSSVLVHGKEIREVFPPIDVDRTRQVRQAQAVTEEMLATFAREAVDAHFLRCASVAEYSLMASIFSTPVSRRRVARRVALVLFSVVTLLTAYWWGGWLNSVRPDLAAYWWGGWHTSVSPEQPRREPPSPSVRWQQPQVAYHSPAGQPFVFPLPTLKRTPEGMPIEVTLEASGDKPSWLELDRERLYIHGTAPRVAQDQVYRLLVRAQAEQGSDSRLIVLLTITDQPDLVTPTRKLPSHWAW